jgi:4'-phosphopantetheinyl transferase
MQHFNLLVDIEYLLDHSKIDIWCFSLSENKTTTRLLNSEELARANRFHFAQHRRRFINSRNVLKYVLSKYTDISASAIEFDFNAHGKPLLSNRPHITFNLSHSEDLALLAVGYHHPLGVDLEYFSERDYLGIAKHIFSIREIDTLQQLSPNLLPMGFFNLWAKKEALIKACGIGLSYPTEQFDLPVLYSDNTELIDPVFKQSWKISAFMPEVLCSAALCFHPSITSFNYYRLNPYEEILNYRI